VMAALSLAASSPAGSVTMVVAAPAETGQYIYIYIYISYNIQACP
jgi:hypothetical protein